MAADEATVERVARALFAQWCSDTGLEVTWDGLLADPDRVTKAGQKYGRAIRGWRDYARVAIDAAGAGDGAQ